MKPHTFRFDYKKSLTQTIKQMVQTALDEDLNTSDNGTDITAELIPETSLVKANLICRESGILCGKDWFNQVFKQLDSAITIHWHVNDGDKLTANMTLCQIEGPARAILSGERSAMNFLQTLSGTATMTNQYVTAIADTDCRLLDTRKTLPGFRLAQKYAVTCGGGHNHRIGLFDAFLIKENHIIACGGISEAIAQAKVNHPEHPIEVEVENLVEFELALTAGANVIMLDNFSDQDKITAVQSNNTSCAVEASGNITLKTINAVARTGVDYISVGDITKNVKALDLSLRLISDNYCHRQHQL